MRKCLILYNEPDRAALPDELDVLDQVEFVSGGLRQQDIEVFKKGITGNFYAEIGSITRDKYDFVFNLVESVGNHAEILYFIPALLNMNRIPYTGCPAEAAFTTASKVLARNIMRSNGIPVAGGYTISEAHMLVRNRKYILKPVWEDGSLGITEESVFVFDGTLPHILSGKDNEHWFIEDFIEGREFNVSILGGENGPEILPPAEMVFSNYSDDMPRIVSYKAKWDEETFQYKNSIRQFPDDMGVKLSSDIRKVALDCWHTFGLRGYARVDMRVDSDENVFVLEVNANPCISPDSGFVAAAARAGYMQAEIIGRIVNDLNNK